MNCEHTLICTDESWDDEFQVYITMQCEKCKARFGGSIKLL